MRWLLLDEIIGIEKGVKARTRSHIPSGEFSPETLMIEMMAQTGGLLVGAEHDFQQDLIFAKIEKADFDHTYKAGEAIEIEATSENLRPEGAWVDARILSGERVIARSRLMLMNAGQLVPGKNGSTTFHDAFIQHFNVRQKVK